MLGPHRPASIGRGRGRRPGSRSTPKRGRNSSIHPAARAEQRLGGDHVVAGTRTWPISAVVTAAMPLAVARAASAPSNSAMRPLDMVHGRIGVARVDVAGLGVVEPRLALLGAVVDEALGDEQRLGGLAELRAQGPGMDEAGFGTVLRGVGADIVDSWIPVGRTRPTKNRPREKSQAGSKRPRPFSDLFYVAASRPAQMTTG